MGVKQKKKSYLSANKKPGMYFLTVILALVLSANISSAKDVIEFGQQSQLSISGQLDIFKPQKGFREISDVLFLDHLFTENNQRLLNISSTDNLVWAKFDIRNTYQYPVAVFLEFRDANIQQIQFYVKKEHLLIHKKLGGIRLPFYQRSIKSRYFVKRIMLEPGINYTIFAKIKNFNNGIKIPVNLYDQQGFNQRISNDNLQAGLFYGIFISLFISSLLFLILRFHVKGQIFYMLYMLSFIALFFMLDGFAFQYFFSDKPYITSYIIKVFPFLIVALFGGLAFNYLTANNIKSISTRMVTGTIIATLLLFSTSVIFRFGLKITMVFVLLLSLAMIFAILYPNLKTLRQDTGNKFFFASLIMGAIVALLFGLQFYLPNYGYNDLHTIIKISVILQLSLIALSFYKGLQINYSKEQQHNIKNLETLNRVIEGQKQELEKKVEERTKSLKIKNAELEEHVSENQTITEELHKQRDEMEILNKELEQAFKKSTADHVRLQKALYLNEQQQEKLQQSFEEIKDKNKTLELQNEEILSQRDKIREQHHLLEIKNRDITDSIIYAERIQNSILPPHEAFAKVFPDSFIYFRPKERLSGDFYWFETVEQKNESVHIVSAIDCTGHGVPGALMSIIAKDGLNEAVNGKDLINPSNILEHLNKVTIKTLNKENSSNNIKDGMDLSLVQINPAEKKIYFAGARNPLYLFRNNELFEYESSIFSVGTVEKNGVKIEFKTRVIDYEQNDTIYLFSDGFVDQFGGEKGNKFRYKRFKKMLEIVVNLPMEKQKERINEIFNKWKGDWEQIDDNLIIGIRL